MYMRLWCFLMLWHQEPPCWLDYDYRIIRIALHPSAVITRSNVTWYFTNHCKILGRISIRGCTHKRHPIPHPDGREYFGENWPRYNRTIYGSKYMWMGFLPDTQNCECACAGNAGNVFPVTAGKRSRHASRHVRHARAVMHAGIAN